MKLFDAYFMARAKRDKKEWQYRHYIADSIFYHEEKKRLTARLADIQNPPEKINAENVIKEVIEKTGIIII